MKAPLEFEGRRFATVRAFRAAFPAYGRHVDLVRTGTTTVADMERALSARIAAARRELRVRARRFGQQTFTAARAPR